jgi:hypothetical protein
MAQQERIKQIVLEEFPGSTVLFHEDVEGKSIDIHRVARLAAYFPKYSAVEPLSFTVIASSGHVAPRIVIAKPKELSDEKVRRLLHFMI